jgi:hypothetical protein
MLAVYGATPPEVCPRAHTTLRVIKSVYGPAGHRRLFHRVRQQSAPRFQLTRIRDGAADLLEHARAVGPFTRQALNGQLTYF